MAIGRHGATVAERRRNSNTRCHFGADPSRLRSADAGARGTGGVRRPRDVPACGQPWADSEHSLREIRHSTPPAEADQFVKT